MAENKTKMQLLFENYNKAGTVPQGGFSKDDLKNHKKVEALKEIINFAFEKIKENANDIFDEFNVNLKITSCDNSDLSQKIVNATKFNFAQESGKQSLDVSVNFNFSKLAQLPPEEVYAAIYHTLYNSLIKRRALTSDGKGYKFGKDVEEPQQDKNAGKTSSQGGIIARYLKKFLCKLLGLTEEDYAKSAAQIDHAFIESGIKPSDMFANPNGTNLLTERFARVAELADKRKEEGLDAVYSQQSTYLLSEISKDQFESLKTGDQERIKAFCENFIRTFAASNGLPPNAIEARFLSDNDAPLGEYVDFGTRQEIQINLGKIKSPSEVVMTLAHELTHAVDSSANKGRGITTKEGYGLQYNIGSNLREEIKEAKGAVGYDFLQELQEICYRVNPNECSARKGEIVAIKFMQGMQPDETMKAHIGRSITSFENYQNKVIEAMSKVDSPEKIAALYAKYSKLFPKPAEPAKSMIEDRLGYLQLLLKNGKLNPAREREAIDIALGRANQQHISEQQTQMEM